MREHSDDQGRLAYEIAELFRVVPGCRETPVSEREFKEWVAAAQEYANSIGYSGSFAYCFGRVLSYAPIGADGIFPHEMVRDYFEYTYSEKLINGFISGKQSQRGGHVVTGGMEEKEIPVSNTFGPSPPKILEFSELPGGCPLHFPLFFPLRDFYKGNSQYSPTTLSRDRAEERLVSFFA